MRLLVRDLGISQQHASADYVASTEHMLVADQVPIRKWLPRLPASSLFPVAATGLGKPRSCGGPIWSGACMSSANDRGVRRQRKEIAPVSERGCLT